MPILYEEKDKIGVVTIDNPPVNVLSTQILIELHKVFDKITANKKLLAVIITGKGKSFIAGADIREMAMMCSIDASSFSRLGQKLCDKIESLEVPVIAAVNGFALGGGTEIALACDIRISFVLAKFGLPEVALGVVPGFGGTQRLARIVGVGKAKELIFTGRKISAKTALNIGLVQEVVSGQEFDIGNIQDNGNTITATMKIARAIAQNGPVAVRASKKLINQIFNINQTNGLKTEMIEFARLFATKDQKEGMKAFTEKRPPKFTGK